MADLGGRVSVGRGEPPVRVTVVTMLPDRRLLLVHAHPDDESIGTGSTMAHYAADGAHVTLVTCTLGEEGEIHVPALAQLAAAEADQLGGYRDRPSWPPRAPRSASPTTASSAAPAATATPG